MTPKPLSRALAAVLAMGSGASAALGEDTTLTIESWRDHDRAIWEETIIPAFEASHPGIKIRFAPTASTEYDAALREKLEAGTAGDLVTCRPFDVSSRLFEKGQLADLTDLPEMASFSAVARSGWSTDDGLRTFCVPVASVIHGFLYNRDIFRELGLAPPKTGPEFFALLDRIKADGTYVAMAMGTRDQWEAATMGFQNMDPITGVARRAGWRSSRARRNSPTSPGSSLCARSRNGRTISARASRRGPIPRARTSSPAAARRSTPPAPGRSRR